MKAPPASRLCVALVLLVSLAGCRADARVLVDVDESGAGTVGVEVALDEEAGRRIGDLGSFVAADDLRRSGWVVVTSEQGATATKEVASPDEVEQALDEVGGPFSGLDFTRDASFLRTRVALSGEVDLRRGLAAFGDDELHRLTGSPTGVDLPAGLLSLRMEVELPGEEEANATGPDPVWELPLGTATRVEAESSDLNIAGMVGVAAAFSASLALLVVGWRSRRTVTGRP